MRLTGGDGKGRRLADAPEGVRPTSGRAKEILFQLVRDQLPDAKVLDLFAGTGALGVEAIARGAGHATFVEKDRRAQAAIRDNLGRCGFQDRAKVIPGDVLKLLAQPARFTSPYDLIFADPPYADDVFAGVMNLLLTNGFLADGGTMMFEIGSRSKLSLPEGWEETDRRDVGDTSLLFFEPI
ncbi:16S rRNA (guanine(966)-N(2))-methyltransferase RsmD [bacterium]|nr:16S rRNA (guanine(966)-N(2))-methyltransferase RsmD [bacterium]